MLRSGGTLEQRRHWRLDGCAHRNRQVHAAVDARPAKLWPPVEDAIRQRAKDRQARLATEVQTVGERRANPVEEIRDRNPIDFMHRRADALTQRAADLKKLGDAWQPLYQTMSPEQKKRMGFLAMYVIRELRTDAEDRRMQSADEETD